PSRRIALELRGLPLRGRGVILGGGRSPRRQTNINLHVPASVYAPHNARSYGRCCGAYTTHCLSEPAVLYTSAVVSPVQQMDLGDVEAGQPRRPSRRGEARPQV